MPSIFVRSAACRFYPIWTDPSWRASLPRTAKPGRYWSPTVQSETGAWLLFGCRTANRASDLPSARSLPWIPNLITDSEASHNLLRLRSPVTIVSHTLGKIISMPIQSEKVYGILRRFLLLLFSFTLSKAHAGEYPTPTQGDFTLKEFRFTSGETLQSLRLHYRTLGTPVKDAKGVVQNAVLILHGTGGSGAQFTRPEFAGELFRPGGMLDADRYFIILPDGIGHGKSGKPSDC